MSIGKQIKKRRKELKLSVDELARRIGKDRSTVYRYEKGDIENLPLDILEPIAKALDTTPQYLIGWKESDADPQSITIGNLFENLRKQSNLSIAEFADEIGLTEAEIKKYESSKGGIPSEIVKILSEYFGISSGKLSAGRVKGKDIFAAFASTNEAYVEQVTKWVEVFGNEKFSNEEFEKIIHYAKFLLYQRGNSTYL